MRIIVTGGAGFIGINFIHYMQKTHPEYEIVCIDNLSRGSNPSAIDGMMGLPHFQFYRVDITDREAVYEVFRETRPDAVINFAAESHVDRSIEDPDAFIKTNVYGTTVLMDACRRFGNIRFHQVSTDEVYGDLPLCRPELLFTEASPPCPSNPYAASKASADLLALSYHRTYGLAVTVSRCSNNYGPYQSPDKLLPLVITSAISNRHIPIYGEGNQVRDWIYVTDHCRAIDLILQGGAVGEIYNVGARCEVSNLDMAHRLLRALGKSEALIRHVKDRAGHDLRYGIDATKIEAELGFRAETALDLGLEDTLRWYLDHPAFWDQRDGLKVF